MKSLFAILFVIASTSICHSQQMNITYKSESQSTRGIGWTVNASYPEVDFGNDALMGLRGIASDINVALRKKCRKMMNDFEDRAKDVDVGATGIGSELNISSESFVNGGTFLSVVFTKYSYFSGAAHPMTELITYNYSTVSSGEIDSISRLFKKDTDYLGVLSEICRKKLTDEAVKNGYDNISEMIEDGTSRKEENYRTWFVENDSLRIIFNPYQAGPYVMGIQEVPIALTELLAYFDPKGPLEYLFR